jgi:uncharacterized protein YbaA (DUF1428 family)
MAYVDGFVIPVPTRNLAAYRRLAKTAARIWRDHGALEYREAVGDHLDVEKVVPFTRLARAKRGETVIFAWIVYKSRAHRDRVNAAVMKDPRIARMMAEKSPFDPRRMAYGGFKIIVSAG